ncbi:odorant receptor 67c-like [Euwallacea fornicatus]|uniref:odorant receptor 67c-like n=1 Tax=Euwallacea fornicatus TaxID=995702 RepID=UPI00338D4D5B
MLFFQIYPKCENLKITMLCCSCTGTFPPQFLFPESKILRQVYTVYSRGVFSYYIVCAALALIEFGFRLNDKPLRKDIVYLNLCTSLLYIITIVRSAAILFGSSFKNVIQSIIDAEARMDPIDDEVIKDLEINGVKRSNKILRNYALLILFVYFLYQVRPFMIGSREVTRGNMTIVDRPLPLSLWLPFDQQEYYWVAFIFHSTYLTLGATAVMSTDVLMINLITYPSRQLKKLDHSLKNFDAFKNKLKTLYDVKDDEKAAVLIFKHFIVQHRKIVKYVDTYNDNMGWSMVVDFIQSSFQIASLVIQIGESSSFFLIFSTLSFATSMITRLYMIYYNGNELMVWSQKLAYSIWESNWLEQSTKVKFMMIIFVLRTQKHLSIFIGPFSEVSVQSLIAVLKATYSYMVIFNK